MISLSSKLRATKCFVLFMVLAFDLFSVGALADKYTLGNLGNVHNEVAKTLVPATKYDNVVNIGCGWASGVNFASGVDWANALPAIFTEPLKLYNVLTDPVYITPYDNKYAVLVKDALEARDDHSINLFDLAKTGHTSPYGKIEIDELDAIIESEYRGQLSGNTLVLYEYGPPDFIRLMGMLYDRDPVLNPIAMSSGGEPFPPGVSAYGDSYWQARFAAEQGGDLNTPEDVLVRYRRHFRRTSSGATPYVDETDVLGEPNSNDLTLTDRFFESYKRDYQRLLDNPGGRYGSKVDIMVIGNDNPYEGGDNFRQYANSVNLDINAIFPCAVFPTFLGCRPDSVATPQLGIDEDFVHPFASELERLARNYTKRMKKQARKEGVSFINAYQLFSGHHSRYDDPTSPHYVAADPTYWAYLGEINALGQEVVADAMLHILNTGKKLYKRRHSSVFEERANANEFPGVYWY